MMSPALAYQPRSQSAGRPSLALKVNPSEASRWIMRRVDRLRGAAPERYPDDYKRSLQAPWPQPSPWDAEGLPPTVLHMPEEEFQTFLSTIASRAARTLWTGSPEALRFALSGEGLDPVSDAEFAERCTCTAFAWFMHRELSAADREVFAPVLGGTGDELFKIDGSAVEGVETLPGIHLAPTVALLRRQGDAFVPLAIRQGQHLYRPTDGDVWELMKYFMLEACAVQLLFVRHPRTHFPYDSIAAVTMTALPAHHRLGRLLAPHFRYQLPLNYGVLYVNRSVAHNNQHEIYTPFAHRRRGFFQLMTRGWNGLPGNAAFPPFSFQVGCPEVPHVYGQYLRAHYDVIHTFVAEALAGLAADDPMVARWADGCAQWVRGFPDGRRLATDGSLVSLVATIIHNVTVVHSADHHSLYAQPIRKVPVRMRVAPPETTAGFKLDRRRLVSREDVFRLHLGRQMWVQPHVLERLLETDYALDESVGPCAVPSFRAALRHLGTRREWAHFAAPHEIATSIQF